MSNPGDDKLSSVRKRAQAQIEQAKREHRHQMLRHRIDTATQGVNFFKEGKTAEAVQKYFTYLRIVEDWKGCAQGQLNPSLFDVKKEISELLLISGIYWDLAKVYDRTKSKGDHAQFNILIKKYVLFAKGMSYQPLCAESLRRYMLTSRAVHRREIRAAYKELTNAKCFIATALVEESQWETLPRLRAFRDQRLATSLAGRAFIKAYYFVAPPLADLVEGLPVSIKKKLGKALDWIAERLSEESSRCDRV